jgi:hypothetical protein
VERRQFQMCGETTISDVRVCLLTCLSISVEWLSSNMTRYLHTCTYLLMLAVIYFCQPGNYYYYYYYYYYESSLSCAGCFYSLSPTREIMARFSEFVHNKHDGDLQLPWRDHIFRWQGLSSDVLQYFNRGVIYKYDIAYTHMHAYLCMFTCIPPCQLGN